MKNIYTVKLINNEGVRTNITEVESVKSARKWAKENATEGKVVIQKNLNYRGMNGYAESTIQYKIK